MSVQIGELLVNLRASTAAFAKDLSKAQQLSFNTAREIERSFQLIGGAALAAGTALAGFVAHSIESAAQMSRMAAATGLSVEQFSALDYATKLTGGNTAQLSKALVTLSKDFEKSNELTQKGAAAHSALQTLFRGDVPVFKSTNEAFLATADRLSKLNDTTLRTALGSHIFGKAWISIAPLVGEGAKGIEELTKRAGELGLVIKTETALAAEQFEQNIKDLKFALEGLSNELAAKTLPRLLVLSQIADGFAKSKWGVESLQAFTNVLKDLYSRDPQNSSFSHLADQLLRLKAAGAQSANSLKLDADSAAAAAAAVEKAAAAHKKLEDAITGAASKLREQIATMGMGSGATEIYRLATLGATTAQLRYVEGLQTQVASLKQIEEFELRQGQRKIDLADKLRLLQQETIEMGKQLDIEMRPQFGKSQQAFTDSITEQTKALQHQITTFGMTSDAIARYDLAMLDTFGVSQKDIAVFKALQDQLAGIQHAADLATKADLANARAWKTFGEIADRSLNDLIFSGKKFTQVLADIGKMIGEMLLKWALLGTSGKGGIFGAIGAAIGIPGLAAGGPASAGTPYMVGESGPELFVPAMSGRIVPNSGVGGGVVVNYNIDARGSSITQEQFVRSMKQFEDRAVQRAILTQRELSLRSA